MDPPPNKMDPALPDGESLAEEREEYLRTIQELFNQLMEAEDKRIEAINEKLEAEERLRQIEAPRGSAEEREYLADQRRRLAEADLGAQIQEAQKFEALYYEEWNRRRSIQVELEEARRRIAELEEEED